ncbi:GntR family transcriptional regulator [Paenarthrobacter sp. YAF11_1]|uniref:GntR family transcriptional regulator n=1 Tax=Paenarthrobacter sp. YAF11_1 TaxID=3233074 RepID=UPI003F972C8A
MVALSEIVDRLDLDDPRRATEGTHARLRELIYSGVLPAGMIISQVELSEVLGVSRTPLREAIRMLQEEGLIDAEPNRRCRIAGFDAADVDSTYGSRLMLEALGMKLTLPFVDREILEQASQALDAMEADSEPGVSPTWHTAHHRFHRSFTSKAPKTLKAQIVAGDERADRYVRQLAQGIVMNWTHGREDHRRILELVNSGSYDEAIVATCQHFARTAVTLLLDVAPEFEPAATRAAVNLVATAVEAPSGLQSRRSRS